MMSFKIILLYVVKYVVSYRGCKWQLFIIVMSFPFQVALGNDKSNLASIVCFYLPHGL